MRAHRALCSAFVDDALYRAALGGGRGDISTVQRYLALPVEARPKLSPWFDPVFYRANYPAAAEMESDPLLHWIQIGSVTGLSPHPLIEPAHIAARTPAAFGDGGPDALAALLADDLAPPGPYFDPVFYREQASGLAGGPLRHFLETGLAQGLLPNRWLDPAWYAAAYPDVPPDRYGALRHFVIIGDVEGRASGPGFDGALYRRRYADVAAAGIGPLRHFLVDGAAEGRQPGADRVRPGLAGTSGSTADTSVEAVLQADARMRGRLAAERQRLKEAVAAVPPPMMAAPDPLRALRRLRFPAIPAPRLSVLIPVFDAFALVVECLMALHAAMPAAGCEVIVADDASPDPRMRRLAAIDGLVVLRQSRNLGFLGNANAGFAACRGAYVLLLNGDTQVRPGAIDHLVAALDADAGLAAVGPKLLYPDGRLQEAGCLVRPSGITALVGLFADPAEPGYCRDRDVAYCSGAALMVRREVVGDAPFDPAFAPAYCEDVDLCLRLAAAGHRIGYVHQAEVVHHLSVSLGGEREAGRLRGIARNQQHLSERWGETLRRADTVRAIAFHLPQFHPTPENDAWWGAGFTEWTNVARARPSYTGHVQPHLPADLGFYDLRLPEALAAQGRLAARYGLAGFAVYHYRFGERRLLHQPIDTVRANPAIPFHWCLCWANENWTRNWDGGRREMLIEQQHDDATLDLVIADAIGQAADPRYLRVDGAPILLVYRPLLLPDPPAFCHRARAAFGRAGFDAVHLLYVESMEAVDRGARPDRLGFDACVEFPPHGRGVPALDSVEVLKEGWAGYRYDYVETAVRAITRPMPDYPRYPGVFPAWDNTPRQELRGASFDGASPEAFRVYVEEKLDEARAFHTGERRLLFVNAWNEWAEGAQLEPDTTHGHRRLEALRDALDRPPPVTP